MAASGLGQGGCPEPSLEGPRQENGTLTSNLGEKVLTAGTLTAPSIPGPDGQQTEGEAQLKARHLLHLYLYGWLRGDRPARRGPEQGFSASALLASGAHSVHRRTSSSIPTSPHEMPEAPSPNSDDPSVSRHCDVPWRGKNCPWLGFLI